MVSFHEYCHPNIVRLLDKKPIITKIRLNLSLFLCHIPVSEFLTLLVSISFYLAYIYVLDGEITTHLIVNLFLSFSNPAGFRLFYRGYFWSCERFLQGC